MTLSVNLIEETNFHNAWWKILTRIIDNGDDTYIGGHEHQTKIKSSCFLITLEGEAIRQIKRREIHPQFPLKHIVDEYCKEFTYNFLEEYDVLPKEQQFSYLYFRRFVNCNDYLISIEGINQISIIRRKLKYEIDNDICSNRNQMVTWDVWKDINSENPPCLQRIQFRYLGNKKFDVHLDWRSRDAYKAWPINIIGLVYMIYNYILDPLGCEIERIVDFNSSLHIYDVDIGDAKAVMAMPLR